MSYAATVFNVMIASPGDVQAERNIAREVVHEWNAIHSTSRKLVLQPISWETHSTPEMGDRPQAIINSQILKASDLLIAIFWTRLGTPTGAAPSGTVEEIEEHVKAGKPAMVYFSSSPVRPDSVDEEQYGALKEFREQCRCRGLVQTYDSPTEFRAMLARHLASTLNTHDCFKAYGERTESGFAAAIAARPRIPEIGKEAAQLLKAACQEQDGSILWARYIGGASVQVGGKDFIEQGNDRSRATWEGALRELLQNGLIKDLGSGEVFQVTRLGYEVADILD